jgi:serine/threonine protein kinase
MVKQTKKKNIKRGGYKLGQGSFGCVVYPGIACKNEKKYKISTASKIVAINDKDDLNEIREEIRINKILRSIDPTNKYFITFVDDCKMSQINPNTLSSRDNLSLQYFNGNIGKHSKCIVNKNKVNYNLVMPYAGNNLFDILYKNTLTYKQNVLASKIKIIIKHLLTGIKLLHRQQIIHQDIKPDNITFDIDMVNKRLQCGIIDFGLAYDIKKMGANDDMFSLYTGTTGYMPPEIYLVHIMYSQGIHKIQDPTIKNKIIKKFESDLYETDMYYKEEGIGVYGVSSKKKSGTKNTIFNFLNPSRENNKFFKSKELYELYDTYADLINRNKLLLEYFKPLSGVIYKHDILSLGITFNQMYIALKINDTLLYDLIKKMISVNPFKRLSITDCLEHPYITRIISKSSKSGLHSTS